MPDKQFLEEYPLYRKFTTFIPPDLKYFRKPSLHMSCSICKSEQTFNMTNEYIFSGARPLLRRPDGKVLKLVYLCEGCREFIRMFFVYISKDTTYFMKVGQHPAWDISVEKYISEMLKGHVDNYKKGLACESQGYGIGAYAYYRRIVEEIIDNLLVSIKDLLSTEEIQRYLIALEKTKNTKNADEKIALVKDLLPDSLRPNNMNPLAILHSSLSEGIHAKTDEDCLDIAINIRQILITLVDRIINTKRSQHTLSESMKKLLDKKSKRKMRNRIFY
jgi:hypothetical protein